MKTIIRLFVLAIFICGFTFSGCSGIETNYGTIAGAIFYSDDTTRVGGGWVRVFDSTGSTIVAETAVDEQARYFIALPEGEYIVMGATSQTGDYTGSGDMVGIFAHETTRYYFAIMFDPPE